MREWEGIEGKEDMLHVGKVTVKGAFIMNQER